MSRFLGPIHEKLYFKIMFLVEMDVFVAKEMKETYTPVLFNKPLEEVVDMNNIHGSLQEMIRIVETEHGRHMSASFTKDKEGLKKALISFGKAHPIFTNLEGIAKTYDTYFLNGMPCDRNVQVLRQEEDIVEIELVHDEHIPYYTDKSILDFERACLFEGMLADGLHVQIENGVMSFATNK